MNRRSVAFVIAVCACFFGTHATSRAAAEICPARLDPISTGVSASYEYKLIAFTPRSVDATLIADTDQGWFSWNVHAVALAPSKIARSASGVRYVIPVAVSAPLAASFPSAVTVRHAWVTSASTLGETFFGWDAQGTTKCDVPAFDEADSSDPLQLDAPQTPPAPASTAVASPATEPFAPTTCARPFAPVKALTGKAPEFPVGVKSWFTGTAAAALSVAVDANGHVLDSWVLAGTGVPDLDKASLAAANGSTYQSGTSYCRAASGYFLFFSTFATTS